MAQLGPPCGDRGNALGGRERGSLRVLWDETSPGAPLWTEIVPLGVSIEESCEMELIGRNWGPLVVIRIRPLMVCVRLSVGCNMDTES